MSFHHDDTTSTTARKKAGLWLPSRRLCLPRSMRPFALLRGLPPRNQRGMISIWSAPAASGPTSCKITFVAAGTHASSTSSVSPGLPSGWAANDIHLLLAMTPHSDTAPTVSGSWNLIQQADDGANPGFPGLWWRRAQTGDTAPTVTGQSGMNVDAIIAGFRGCIASGSPIDVSEAWAYGASSSSYALTIPSITTVAAYDLALLIEAVNQNIPSATLAWSGSFAQEFTSFGNSYEYGFALAALSFASAGSTVGSQTVTSSGTYKFANQYANGLADRAEDLVGT